MIYTENREYAQSRSTKTNTIKEGGERFVGSDYEIAEGDIGVTESNNA